MSDARIEHSERRIDGLEDWKDEAKGSLRYLQRLAESSEARLIDERKANEARLTEERKANEARLTEERKANEARLTEERKAYAEERKAYAEERRANDARLSSERRWSLGLYAALMVAVFAPHIIDKFF